MRLGTITAALRLGYAALTQELLDGSSDGKDLARVAFDLRGGEKPVPAFHWEIEFPEVFSRENPGFDAFVGNPPFLGGRNASTALGSQYSSWLLMAHEDSSGGADLAAHFYRQAFDLLRKDGAFGLIATNTIAQGDTRSTGLRWICVHGGRIFAATRRWKWPGLAAVVVSVVHIRKGKHTGQCLLDNREVSLISAFLFHAGGNDDPERLAANAGRSFQGSIVLGMGFTFDDGNGESTPISEMYRLIEKDPRNAERILPYIGGEEVNESPTHAHRRYVIDFGVIAEEQANAWPDLMGILRAKVRPERGLKSRDMASWPWWRFWRPRPELVEAIRGLGHVLVNSQISARHGLAFLPSTWVYSHALNVFALPTFSAFCTLQSRPHELWARFFGSSLEDRLRYTPTDCFETFPFPLAWETNPDLELAGRTYYEFRAALMVGMHKVAWWWKPLHPRPS